jgi:hypothetical protein
MVWEDVKKLGALLFDQTKEQKDIVLLKLREVSYNNKKENALARLGEIVFSLTKSGSESIPADNSDVSRIVNEIHKIDEEIGKINDLVESLKKQAAGERETMASDVTTVWEKTKTAFTSEEKRSATNAAPPRAEHPDADTKKNDAPKPPKQPKASTAKKSGAKAKGGEKKGDQNNKGRDKV